jgi:hypothetical protein
MSSRGRWLMVVVFATAMAWMESATVVYLRMLVDRVIPYQAHPLPAHPVLGATELIRELATLLMLVAVGCLAGRNARQRFGYLVIAWGVWDILYYVFLYAIVGWPTSLFDWDVLFLIPLPWWAPVLAPVSIAALMIAGGTLITQFDCEGLPLWPSRRAAALSTVGVGLGLAVFMADSFRVVGSGEQALRAMLPERFDWPLFLLALVLMFLPVGGMLRQLRRSRAQVPDAEPESNLGLSDFG